VYFNQNPTSLCVINVEVHFLFITYSIKEIQSLAASSTR